MNNGWVVTANDIKHWTETRKHQAEGLLPELVRKLISASCKPDLLHFPSGDSINTGGWDGTLNVNEWNEYVPLGLSVWEFGTEKSINKKFEEDYIKRTANPNGINISETTFVFVTSRNWKDKNEKCAEKDKERVWKQVRGINADDLEYWLHQCPAVHRWFANKIGKRPEDAWDIDQAWDSWINGTSTPATFELALNGRADQSEKLANLLKENSSTIIQVKLDSEIEAYAFVLATLMQHKELSPKALVVRDKRSWDVLLDTQNSLILIPRGFTPENVGYAKQKGHFVIMLGTLSNIRNSSHYEIKLKRTSREDRISALRSMGLNNNQAEQIYNDTHGFLGPIMRHRLLMPNEYVIPEWVNNFDGNIIIAALFATQWDNRKEKDKETLSKLAGFSYEQVEEKLLELASVEDAPIRLIDNVWQVISKIDLWSLISYKINRQSIERLDKVIFDVLSELDPSYDLIPQERWIANIKGAIPEHSTMLKLELADTLALLATFGDQECQHMGEIKLRYNVEYLVKELLNKDISARGWYSFGGALKYLSEASPESFLDALQRTEMKGDNLSFGSPFIDNGEYNGYSHANDLLCALETISWKLEYLPLVSNALCRLSEIDLLKRSANSPLNILKEIYLGWNNNTVATYKECLQIIDSSLIKFYPEVSWNLLISILPDMYGICSTPICKPTYRDWAGVVKKKFKQEYDQYIEDLADRLLNLLDQNPESRWPDLIENINRLPNKHFNKVIEKILSIDRDELSAEARLEIANKLRFIISQHREFEGKEWTLPKSIIDKLEEVYYFIIPDATFLKYKYLFDEHYPRLIDPLIRRETNFEERDEIIECYRKDALLEVYRTLGIDGIKQLAIRCYSPDIVGKVIASSELKSILESELLNWLECEDSLVTTSQSFVLFCANIDKNWANEVLKQSRNWTEDKLVNFLAGLPFNQDTFDILSQLNENTFNEYWRKIKSYNLSNKDLGKVNWVIEHLLLNERPWAALKVTCSILYNYNSEVSFDFNVLSNILQKIAIDRTENEKEFSIMERNHMISEAIKFIQEQKPLSEEDIIRIEWMYIPYSKSDIIKPKYLEKELLNEPEFFSQIVSFVYKSDEDKEDKEDLNKEIILLRAKRANTLLDQISKIPGQKEDFSVDDEKLREWVNKAREHLKRLGRKIIGDYQIGEVLSNSPLGRDSIWPHESVRDLIEELQSPDLEKGLIIGKMNSRGPTTRFVFDGGKQERELSMKYEDQAQIIKLKWPRTAEILRHLKGSYEYDASRQDSEVELMKLVRNSYI